MYAFFVSSFAQLFQCCDLKATICPLVSPHSPISLSFNIFPLLLTSSTPPFSSLIMRFYVVLAVAVSSVFASPLAISSNLDSRGTANLAGTIGFGACLGGPDCCGIDDFNFCFCAASDQAMGNVCPRIIYIINHEISDVHSNHSAV